MKTKTIINKINGEFRNESGKAILDIMPIWKDGSLKNFSISILSFKDDDYTDFSLSTTVDVDALIDLLVELRGHHIDKYAVQVYAYYHGCDELAKFYNDLMENLDLYEEFNMEYEWGWKPLILIL